MAMIDDLISRVGNLNDLKLRAYMDADGMFYGGTPAVWRLIKGARDACDDGNFALCERICDVAERKLASEARKFKNKTQAQRMQHAEEFEQSKHLSRLLGPNSEGTARNGTETDNAMKLTAKQIDRYRLDPAAFIEERLIDPITNRPSVLLPAERAFIKLAFEIDEETGRLRYPRWCTRLGAKAARPASPR